MLEHKTLKVNHLNFHYVTQGEGELMILLHGFPEFWYGWKLQIPFLAQHYKVVAPDMRGYNLSDKPDGVSAYRMKTLSSDIAGMIDQLGGGKAIVVAHDWGGAVAYDLATHYPEKVQRLITLNIPHPKAMMDGLRSSWRQKFKSWYMAWFQIPWLPETLMKVILKTTLRKTLRGWAYNQEAFSDADLAQYAEAMRQPKALKSMINYYRAAFKFRKENETRASKPLTVPTRVIWGENDKALGKELTLGMDKYFAGHYEIHYLPQCSHWVQHEYPDQVNHLILEFALLEDLT